ncbi:MAG: hypothetical protein ABIK65_02530 [Candidatus Eisenbacteria bacterium]
MIMLEIRWDEPAASGIPPEERPAPIIPDEPRLPASSWSGYS